MRACKIARQSGGRDAFNRGHHQPSAHDLLISRSDAAVKSRPSARASLSIPSSPIAWLSNLSLTRTRTALPIGRMKASLPLIVLLVCAGCSEACQNEIALRERSPDGRHAVVLFQRDCGATTGFSTQISILGTSDKPSGGGNAFIADDNHGAARVGDWGGSWAEMRWLSPDRLLIRYAVKSRLFKQRDEVSGVRITYQAVSS